MKTESPPIPAAPPIRPLGSNLLIGLDPEAVRSKGGIWIPEVARKRPVSGTVVAVGPGRSFHGRRSTIWTSVGDEVLFQRRHLREIARYEEHALLLAEDVLAWVDRETVHPENDWILVEMDAREAVTEGGIIIPETGRKKARSGVVRDMGPGRLLLTGELAGTRKDVPALLGLKTKEEVCGRSCQWSGEEEVVHLSRPVGHALVRASDMLLIQGDES